MALHISHLYESLYIHIFCYLEAETLLICAQVCQYWLQLVQKEDHHRWQAVISDKKPILKQFPNNNKLQFLQYNRELRFFSEQRGGRRRIIRELRDYHESPILVLDASLRFRKTLSTNTENQSENPENQSAITEKKNSVGWTN